MGREEADEVGMAIYMPHRVPLVGVERQAFLAGEEEEGGEGEEGGGGEEGDDGGD